MANEISSEVVNERNHSWVVEVNEKLKNMPSTQDKELLPSKYGMICKLPAKQPDSIYTPCLVSFGPYYYSHGSCVRTQDIKERVVLYSLWRWKKTADSYVEALSGMVQDLKDAYGDFYPKRQIDDEAFLKLMIYDGCFIIEILRETRRILQEANYQANDPVYKMEISPKELMERYRNDMLLLENQLPMSVLAKLVAVQAETSVHEAREILETHILEFFFPTVRKIPTGLPYWHALELCRHSLLHEPHKGEIFLSIAGIATKSAVPSNPSQLLGFLVYHLFKFLRALRNIFKFLRALRNIFKFLRPIYKFLRALRNIFKFLRPLRNIFNTRSHIDHFHSNIQSATELKKVGIGFSMSKSTSLRDISVGRRRILRLPQIYVDGATKSMFLNVIAFEQVYADIVKSEVTSYIYFMCSLLQDADDVKLLASHGIIRTTLSNNEVVELFNSMAKDILRDPKTFLVQKYIKVGRTLREHFNKMSDEWQRDLWQNYLRSPWAIISLIAAFLLFALTAFQTMYTILGYYNPK